MQSGTGKELVRIVRSVVLGDAEYCPTPEIDDGSLIELAKLHQIEHIVAYALDTAG